MSDATEMADLMARVASVRDRLGRRVFLRAVARAKFAVARAVLDDAEYAVELRRQGGTVVPFATPSKRRSPGDQA